MTAQPIFAVKRQQSLRLQALEQIRQAIVTGTMEPGSLYSEQTIASNMSISRTPVREALLQLEREGLIEFVPQRGARVREFDAGHLSNVLELRSALESFCAAHLAKNPNLSVITRLDDELERQQKIIAANDHLAWVIANMDFHATLVSGVENPLFDAALPPLASHTMRIGFRMIARRQRMQESFDEHSAIVNAIRSCDPDRARTLTVEHLHITSALMEKLFSELGPKLDKYEVSTPRKL